MYRTCVIFLTTLLIALTASALFPALPAAADREEGERDSGAEPNSRPASQGRWLFLPVLGYSPETRLMGGAMGMRLLPSGGGASVHSSSYSMVFVYTQESQVTTKLAADLYSAQGRYHVMALASYTLFPSLFFGIGRDAPESQEESFTSRTTSASLSVERRLRAGLSAGLACECWRSSLSEVEEGGLLAGGRIPGSDRTQETGLGLIATWDTRDGKWFTSRGSHHQIDVYFYAKVLGSDHEFRRTRVNLRRFFPLGKGHVLAMQALAEFQGGSPPFQALAKLGGNSVLRGCYEGRYRDRNLLVLQGEYRLPALWRRWGLVLFGALGDVAPEPGELSLGRAKLAGGLGLRYLVGPKEGLNIRFDFGIAESSRGFYVTLGEAY